jgi:hypothetical protein
MQGRKRGASLNKFLSKAYHMIDQCDPSIASWSAGGDSFTIKHVQTFEKEVLPEYFSHGKISSFIRQLNFYGFLKLVSEPDLQVRTTSVRFQHKYFRKGKPELLQNIRRSTAPSQKIRRSTTPSKSLDSSTPTDQMELYRQQVAILQQQVKTLESQMNEKLKETAYAIEESYMARINNLEASNENILSILIQLHKQDMQASSRTTSWLTSSPSHWH